MDDETLYRVEFRITRRKPGDEDFTEIGFGSSGGCGTVDAAAFEAESMIANRIWETEPGQPEPETIGRDDDPDADILQQQHPVVVDYLQLMARPKGRRRPT